MNIYLWYLDFKIVELDRASNADCYLIGKKFLSEKKLLNILVVEKISHLHKILSLFTTNYFS